MVPSPRNRIFSALLVLVVSFLGSATQAADLSVVERWLATNSGLRTIRIDFEQTRKMRSLKVPIRQPGTLWLNYATKQFRWQTGNPPQTIVVRRGSELFVIRTPMKRYERRPVGSSSGGTPGMAALAGGFPKTLGEFQKRYRILGISRKDNTHRIVTQPLGESGRGVDTFTFVIEEKRYRLLGFEMKLKDGSSVDTVFHRVLPNDPIPKSVFAPDITGFKETKF